MISEREISCVKTMFAGTSWGHIDSGTSFWICQFYSKVLKLLIILNIFDIYIQVLRTVTLAFYATLSWWSHNFTSFNCWRRVIVRHNALSKNHIRSSLSSFNCVEVLIVTTGCKLVARNQSSLLIHCWRTHSRTIWGRVIDFFFLVGLWSLQSDTRVMHFDQVVKWCDTIS